MLEGVSTTGQPSAGTLAAVAAVAARDAKRAAILDDVVASLAIFKAGTQTANDRDKAIRRALRALKFLLAGDPSE